MSFDYVVNPQEIEKESFRRIRELISVDGYDSQKQQVILRMVHSLGMPDIVEQVRFSSKSCEQGIQALITDATILCDVEMVKQGITKRMINNEPLCYLNHAEVAALAKDKGETRSMAALALWQEQLGGSIVIIGNAPTALFRLLEMLEQGAEKPALIIGMPVGFVGAEESKQALWDEHKDLGVECITLLGRQGGSAVASSVCNALLRCNHGEYY